MKAVLFLLLFFSGMALAESEPVSKQPGMNGPSVNAQIETFRVTTQGTLHITYSDGTEVDIPKGSRPSLYEGERALTQEAFSDIQLADDRRHIGWLPEYMVCAQSYPCTPELVIYNSHSEPKSISPPSGIVWTWKFLKAKQVVMHYGFPHGDDTGVYGLYDSETGSERARFSPGNKRAPKWVRQLQTLEKVNSPH